MSLPLPGMEKLLKCRRRYRHSEGAAQGTASLRRCRAAAPLGTGRKVLQAGIFSVYDGNKLHTMPGIYGICMLVLAYSIECCLAQRKASIAQGRYERVHAFIAICANNWLWKVMGKGGVKANIVSRLPQ